MLSRPIFLILRVARTKHFGVSANGIKMLSEADYFIGVYDEGKAYRGCTIENQAAKAYGIPSYTINLNYVARDVVEARAKEARKYSCFGY